MTIAYGNSWVGRRANNEDAFCVEPQLGLYAVADGMGGHEGGEVASRIVVDVMRDFLSGRDVTDTPDADLERAINNATDRVRDEAVGELAEMGSTVAALLVREERVVIAHVGDSRVYRLRDGVLEAMTRDHSLCSELEDAGYHRLLSVYGDEISHFITRCIAADGNADVELRTEPAKPGDVFLLCSDGLSDVLSEDIIRETLISNAPHQAGDALLELAYREGSSDNITAVVVGMG